MQQLQETRDLAFLVYNVPSRDRNATASGTDWGKELFSSIDYYIQQEIRTVLELRDIRHPRAHASLRMIALLRQEKMFADLPAGVRYAAQKAGALICAGCRFASRLVLPLL